MNFTERHHAFISACFYRHLRDEGFRSYRDAFWFASRRYAEQRGSRMAQRAIRDGKPLDYTSYRLYGEWAPTAESRAEGFRNEDTFSVTKEGDDIVFKYLVCPWSGQYLDMGLKDGANLYCSDLDAAIVRGFNPKLTYDVVQTMHDRQDFCLQIMRGAASLPDPGPQDPDNVKDFGYHCGHVYSTFSKAMAAIYGERGKELSQTVLSDFAQEYGKELAAELERQAARDYEYI